MILIEMMNIFNSSFFILHLNLYLCIMIIHNRFIPFKKFYAINLFGVIFVRHGVHLHAEEINHERIHTAQMREMLFIFFYIWYGMEWFILLFKYRNSFDAYKNIRFEKEAYRHGDEIRYLKHRKPYAWLREKKKE